jgi:hypothetical protein
MRQVPLIATVLTLAIANFSVGVRVSLAQEEAPAGGGRGAAAARANAKVAEMAALATPKGTDGHPDLNGTWGQPGGGIGGDPTKLTRDGKSVTYDFGAAPPEHKAPNPAQAAAAAANAARNAPTYKPELLAKVKELDDNQVKEDPGTTCAPLGVPRIGAPQMIVQTPAEVIFIYGLGDEGVTSAAHRVIPMNQPHLTDADPSYLGDSVGSWDGDTLVVDVTNFNDDTWFDGEGHFHSDSLHVVERFQRQGNVLRYQVMVEDPKVLTKPWVMPVRSLILTNERYQEPSRCKEMDAQHIVGTRWH